MRRTTAFGVEDREVAMSTRHTMEAVALVTAARSGDQAAQDALVGAYLPLVYNIVGRALNGSVDVDDVVQDTMLRVLDSLETLRDPASFRSWLVAVAMNQVRAHWHRQQPAQGAMEEADDVADPGADFVDLTIVQLQLSGQRQETARATRWLEPDDRGLLSLWWLECAGELTRAEIAEALALSPQHTAVRVQRMKAQLEAARVVVRALDARPQCQELRGELVGWDGRPSALWRKRTARHARGCAQCSGLWSGLMPAEGLLAGLALVGVSSALLARMNSAAGTAAVAARRPRSPGAGTVTGSSGRRTTGPREDGPPPAATHGADDAPAAGRSAVRSWPPVSRAAASTTSAPHPTAGRGTAQPCSPRTTRSSRTPPPRTAPAAARRRRHLPLPRRRPLRSRRARALRRRPAPAGPGPRRPRRNRLVPHRPPRRPRPPRRVRPTGRAR